ncbi:MAG: ribosomal RNA small subunit methyltransferase A, partial [Phycisphaerales bacterium]
MQSLSEIKAILSERGLRPRHRFGQNFLIEPMHLRRLVEAASIAAGDAILEVGPGTGTLTEELLASGARIVASEIDRDLASLLRERFGDVIQLVEGDVLSAKRSIAAEVTGSMGGREFKLVSNLPYQIASPLLAILASDPRCLGCFVTVQREVADRLGAGPGKSDYGPLSVVV